MLSRPRRVQCTSRAFSITRKCLVIAWRVMRDPSLRPVMDIGPWRQRRATMSSRVSSPRAAKIGAEDLGVLCKVPFDECNYEGPTLLVGGEGCSAALERDAVEAGFGHCK